MYVHGYEQQETYVIASYCVKIYLEHNLWKSNSSTDMNDLINSFDQTKTKLEKQWEVTMPPILCY